MKEYTPENIRNVAIIGHGGSGKTIFTDALLLCTGAATRIGSIEDGSTVSDYRPDEIERQISINSTLVSTEHGETKFNILDTPGYTDFIGDVISSLKVCDQALLLLKAVEGVEVGSELVWKYAAENETPVIIAVNKIDNEHADFDAVVAQATDRFGHGVTLVQFPVKNGTAFNSVVDVLSMKMRNYKADSSGQYDEVDIPDEHKGRAEELREALIEKVAESTEELMNSFFEHGELSDEELLTGLKTAIRNRTIFPVFASSGETNVGVAGVVDFISKYGPSPVDIGEIALKKGDEDVAVPPDAKKDPVIFIF